MFVLFFTIKGSSKMFFLRGRDFWNILIKSITIKEIFNMELRMEMV
jgi:hypothetical protein